MDRQSIEIRRVPVGPLSTNCYLVWLTGPAHQRGDERAHRGAAEGEAQADRAPAVVIDPGAAPARLLNVIGENRLDVQAIINTHGHPDHIGGNAALRKATGAPVYVGEGDAPMLEAPLDLFGLLDRSGASRENLAADRILRGGETLRVAGLEFAALDTPGHTPGGISLWLRDHKVVFTGDTLFCRGVGRTDFPGGHESTLMDSIYEVLFSLDDETIVLPGHGVETTIAAEKEWHGVGRSR